MHVNPTLSDLINPHRSIGTTNRIGPPKPVQPPAHVDPAKQTGATRIAVRREPPIHAREVPLAEIKIPDAAGDSTSSAGQLTPEGLRAAWGESNSNYDLNADGTVNFADMLKLLAMIGESDGNLPAPPGTPAPAPNLDPSAPNTDDGSVLVTPLEAGSAADLAAAGIELDADDPNIPNGPPVEPGQPGTLEGLLAAWGEQGGEFDLNGDGTVNFGDVLELLGRLRSNGDAPETPGVTGASNLAAAQPELQAGTEIESSTGTPDISSAEPETIAEAPITIDDIIAAWGKRDQQLDLNQDGTVNFADILELIGRSGTNEAPAAAQAQGAAGAVPNLETQEARRVQPITESLIAQLREKGFDEHPPSNIHEVVSQLDLEPAERDSLIEQLASRYPAGLGVNLTI